MINAVTFSGPKLTIVVLTNGIYNFECQIIAQCDYSMPYFSKQSVSVAHQSR